MSTLEEMKAQRKGYASYGKVYGDRTIADKRYEAHRPKTNRTKEFIAWDGEGVDDKYVLFMNSKGDKITSLDGLSTDECLLFLCSIKERYPDAINVVFGGSYDANMILKDLPFKHLQLLQKNNRVYYKYFKIEYIPRKYFMVSQYDHKVYGDKRKRKPKWTVTLWDVIGFFQGSFLKSLNEYFKNDNTLTNLHLDEIAEGKKRRNDFSEDELHAFIIPYCRYEVDALVLLMDKVRENMLNADIHIRRWDGAGAAAAALLKQYGVKKHYQKLPKHIEEICQVAYGGGRVEMFKYGHTDAKFSENGYWYHLHPDALRDDHDDLPLNFFEGLIYHYDIIGAYPSVMPLLPSLVGGKWVHDTTNYGNVNMLTSDEISFDDFTLYRVYWDYRDSLYEGGIYPFFYRQPWNQPRIFYSEQGYSWVAGPELKAAHKWVHKLGGELHVLESWQFVPATDEKPFAFVEELYKLRMKYKAEGNGAQLALKLAINALYGKMAQTVGYQKETEDQEEKFPPFYNLFYALLITSFTRAKMFDAMMQEPESIIACATDGLWSLKPLKLNISKKGEEKLGEWEHEELLSFTSVQAGVYFCTKSDGTPMYHYRGFNQGSIQEDAIIKEWANLGYTYAANTRRFVTLGTSLASHDRWKKVWRTWEESKRMLEIVPMHNQKREAPYPSADAATMLLPTYTTPIVRFEEEIHNVNMLTNQWMSKKHPLPWEFIELTPQQWERRQQEEMLWEIIEGDIDAGEDVDMKKEGEF